LLDSHIVGVMKHPRIHCRGSRHRLHLPRLGFALRLSCSAARFTDVWSRKEAPVRSPHGPNYFTWAAGDK